MSRAYAVVARLPVSAMIGFCFYRLGMYRDAERQLQSSFKDQPMVLTCLLQAKVASLCPALACVRHTCPRGATAWQQVVLCAGSHRMFECVHFSCLMLTPQSLPPVTPQNGFPTCPAPSLFLSFRLPSPYSQVHVRLDQPQQAIACYRAGLKAFPGETSLLAGR